MSETQKLYKKLEDDIAAEYAYDVRMIGKRGCRSYKEQQAAIELLINQFKRKHPELARKVTRKRFNPKSTIDMFEDK